MNERFKYIRNGSIRRINPVWVKEYFSHYGYTLESEYKSSNQPLQVLCPNGHKTFPRWGDFYNTHTRCIYCSKRRIHPNDVVKAFTDAGYELISNYVKATARLKFKCKLGHVHEMTYREFQKGKRVNCGENIW
jgi:hypothetical protein